MVSWPACYFYPKVRWCRVTLGLISDLENDREFVKTLNMSWFFHSSSHKAYHPLPTDTEALLPSTNDRKSFDYDSIFTFETKKDKMKYKSVYKFDESNHKDQVEADYYKFVSGSGNQTPLILSSTIHSSSGQMESENVVFSGCGRRGRAQTWKHKFNRLSKAQSAMRVLRRVSWLKAVRHCPYRSPDWSFTVSLWLILRMFLRLTWYCGKAALRRAAASCLCTWTPSTAYFLWYCPHTWGKT